MEEQVVAASFGGIAQLGEHLPCKQGVKGSNPFISTCDETDRRSVSRIANDMYHSFIAQLNSYYGLIAQPVRAHA